MRDSRTLDTLEALQEEARAFVSGLLPSDGRATLITLSGDLGAGKTSFVQGVAKTLGVTEAVTSPTFVLAKSYDLGRGAAFHTLLHIDAYRLSEGKDLAPLRLDEYLEDASTLVLLEWPEMVADGLPPADVAVTLRVEGEGRHISYA